MATFGFIVICIIGLFFLAQGLLFVVMGSAFSGKFESLGLIPLVIGVGILYFAYTHVPFVITFTQHA